MFKSKFVFGRSVTATAPVLFLLFVIVSWMVAETTREDDGGEGGCTLRARILATGIPGAGAVAEVGDFLRGSP